MDIVRNSAPRAGRIFAALGVLTASVLTAVVPAIVSADTITERSVELSSSAKSATGVGYKVKFTAQHNGTGAFLIDFCTTAAIGSACTAPTGLNVGTAATATSGYTASTISTNSVKVLITAPVDLGDPVELDVTGLTNTSTVGAMYARIVTYADDTALGSNTSAAPGTHYDDGSVALDITDGFSVNGSVLESLTFCASGTDVANCSSSPTPPNIVLGSSGVLNTTAGTDGDVFTYISTNAVGGAVVHLKSDATNCGGLYRDGVADAAHCGIKPITTAALLADSDSKFGAKLALTQPSASPTNGTLTAAANWSPTNYYMPYVDANTGVTSVYGAEVYNTTGGPTEQGEGKLSFNANRSEMTPAGNYSAKFSLIATGTF